MAYFTPLRYPGGKRRLIPFVESLLDANGLKDIQYAEPYAGGAAIGLSLLLNDRADTIHLNDFARPVHAFWHSVLEENAELCKRIAKTKVTMTEWRKQRRVYEQSESADILDLGFSTLFLNRTNRSGILGGGVIGGKNQEGEWKLDARFTKDEIISRIRRIGRYSGRIKLHRLDAVDFTEQVVAKLGKNSFAFYDPPYIENGQNLYLNEYDLEGHLSLSKKIQKLRTPWVVTYDHSAVTHGLFPTQARIEYALKYTAQGRYSGREAMFLSNRVKLPMSASSGKILLSAPKNKFRVEGTVTPAIR